MDQEEVPHFPGRLRARVGAGRVQGRDPRRRQEARVCGGRPAQEECGEGGLRWGGGLVSNSNDTSGIDSAAGAGRVFHDRIFY